GGGGRDAPPLGEFPNSFNWSGTTSGSGSGGNLAVRSGGVKARTAAARASGTAPGCGSDGDVAVDEGRLNPAADPGTLIRIVYGHRGNSHVSDQRGPGLAHRDRSGAGGARGRRRRFDDEGRAAGAGRRPAPAQARRPPGTALAWRR